MQTRASLPLAAAGLLLVTVGGQFLFKGLHAMGMPVPAEHQALADPVVPPGDVLDLNGFEEASSLSGNQLAFHDKFEGRPVLMNVDLVSVTKDGSNVVVALQAYQRHDSTILTSLSASYPMTCTFKDVTETKPLSGWQPHQEIQLSGKLGENAKTMNDCVLSAYVNANGQPAGLGSIVEAINGKVRLLSRSQMYPPLVLTN